MSIEIILRGRASRDETRQRVFVSVSGVNSYTFDFEVGDVLIELDTDELVLSHLEARKDELHLFCLRKTWIGYDISEFKESGKSELESFLDWIEAGAINPDGTVITNHPYEGKHPPQFAWIEMIEEANSIPDLKEILIDIFKEQI